VLEALGVHLNLAPEAVARCIAEVGIGFMFAPNFHGAMRHAAPVRRELGVRTLFNILGPLTNPAGATRQLLGVFHPDLVGIQVRVLQRLGSQRALVVHGSDGLDEITLAGDTLVGELSDGQVSEYVLSPAQFGFPLSSTDAIRVADAASAKAMLLSVLDDTPGPARDIVLLNSGATLYVAGVAGSIAAGIDEARRVLASGAARDKLRALVAFSRQAASQ